MKRKFCQKVLSLEKIGMPDFCLDDKVTRIISSPSPENWEKSGITRESYLDFMEIIVRNASRWIDGNGAVIAPYCKKEWAQTTPRFVSSASILLYFGRIPELGKIVNRSMTYSCKRLASGQAESPDFWMRELVTAYICLSKSADMELVGGRSGQFNFQEGIISALCEIEAERYKESDPLLAGAFKRQAHLSAKSVGRWLQDMSPPRHSK